MAAEGAECPTSSQLCPVVREALLGGGASAVAACFSNPIDIVRVRMQLAGAAPKLPRAPLYAALALR